MPLLLLESAAVLCPSLPLTAAELLEALHSSSLLLAPDTDCAGCCCCCSDHLTLSELPLPLLLVQSDHDGHGA